MKNRVSGIVACVCIAALAAPVIYAAAAGVGQTLRCSFGN